jgi:diadenosine tetraphosphate (Ap4A) HIT family hydrolase
MLTPEQVKELKEQLLKQLVHFPEEKRMQMQEQILQMNDEQFEEFLIANGLIQREGETSGNRDGLSREENETEESKKEKSECIFCSILTNKIPSYKIDENKSAIAILEINPLSKAHILIIPKSHAESEKIPSKAFVLAKKIAKKIKAKFHPKEIKISSISPMGHSLVEVLPLYGNEKERKKATQEELFELQKALITKTKTETPQERKEKIQKKKEKQEEEKQIKISGLPKFLRLP